MAKKKAPKVAPVVAMPAAAIAPPTATPAVFVDPAITTKLKDTREQLEVVGPIVQYLNSIGWKLEQMQFGRKEWRVPKKPSEATKREKNQSYEGFPCDVAIFDSPDRRNDPQHLIIIVEAKIPDEEAGVSQLETYMGLEPHVSLGIWVNEGDPSALAVFVFRNGSGKMVRRRRPLTEAPRPGESIDPSVKRLLFNDLTIPTPQAIKRTISEMLDRVVIEDTVVMRREDQLDQLCNLFLLKLHSDKRAKLKAIEPPLFRPLESVARTAEEMRAEFRKFVGVYPDTFTTDQDRELRLSDQTIYSCVERLAPYRLIDVGISTIALGFQVLRSAALRQKEGQYFTPLPVISAGIRLMKVDFDDIVIDPACGTGGFLVEALLDMQRRHPDHQADLSRWAQTNIFGIDKDRIGVKLTKAIMQIAGDGSAHCVRGDTVRTYLWAKEFPHLNHTAFADGRFTVVVTNPPFGKKLKVSANDARIANLDIAQEAGDGEYKDLEIGLHFLQRAHRLLRVGGRVGIILPETYFFSTQYRFVFEWMKTRLKPLLVANVPMEAFQGFCRAKKNFYVFEKVG